MGEIADAIRRARGQGSVGGADPSLKGLDLATPELEAPPAPAEPQAEVETATWVETIDPQGPAVLPEVGPHAEICRQLALRLREQLELRGSRSVAVVSAERGDGKSTVACNLAVATASMSRGRSVALVDLDLRKPSLARYLGLTPKIGMEDVLLGKAALDSVRIPVRHPAIDIYPVRRPQNAAHELLVLPALGEIMARLERSYEFIIVDTPPAPLVPDASLILRHVSCCVPVVRKGKTRTRSVKRMVHCLPARSLLGWVVNCDRSSEFRDEDYYYHDGDGR